MKTLDKYQWENVDRDQISGVLDFESTMRHDDDSDIDRVATLPAVTLRSIGEQPSLFEVGARLGLGGMGEVRVARQPALHRDVAIKRPRADGVDRPSRILLREALVMGYLEHPNIVPIHVVGRDESGEPVVAMKRIEGVTLDSLLIGDQRLRRLDANVEILVQVCHAIEFAHGKGIVHLDLKPANIMVGDYGEVYVLDWGTAVAFRDDVPETLPRPLNDKKVRGTPSYMAPEMVCGAPVLPQTDVYQLGGLLHALVTGRGPNHGSTASEVFKCAFESKRRDLPEIVPRELADVIHTALARLVEHRYPSAAEFRKALEHYLHMRTARDMSDAARRSVAAFRKAIVDQLPAPKVYSAFGAARQLIADAQTAASDPAYGESQAQQLLEQMCRWELNQNDNPAGAQALLLELPRPNDELTLLVENGLLTRESEKAELVELRRQADPSVANKQKIAMWLLIGGVIAAIYAVPALLGYKQVAREALFGHTGYLVVLAFVTIGFRIKLFETRVNREIVGLVWVMSLFGLFVRIAAFHGALELKHAMGLDLALVATVTSYGALMLDRRAAAAVPFYTIGALACFVLPFDAGLVFGLSHGVGLSAIALTYVLMKRG